MAALLCTLRCNGSTCSCPFSQKVIGFVSFGAVATLFLVGGFCAIPL